MFPPYLLFNYYCYFFFFLVVRTTNATSKFLCPSLYIEYINQTQDLPPLIVLDILFKLLIRTISFNLAVLTFDLFVGPGSIYSKDLISLKCTLQVLWNFDPSDVIYNWTSFKKFKGAKISMKPLQKLQTILIHNCKTITAIHFC